MAIASTLASGWLVACGGIPDPPEPLSIDLPAVEPAEPLRPIEVPEGPPHADELGLPRAPSPPLPEPLLEWWPVRPIQASVVTIRLHVPYGPPLDDVRIRFAGHDLRAASTPSGWVGIGSVPLDSAGFFELEYDFERLGDRTVRRVVLPVMSRTYPSSRIRISARPPSEPDPDLDARILRERETIQAALADSDPVWYPQAPFVWPRDPVVKTSPFGQRRVFNGSVRSRHMGLDLRARYGNPIRAPAAGRVALADRFFYQGNAVYVDHGLGLFTAYFHMSSIAVEVGDIVEPGDLLGRGGSTGRSTAAHLHWSAYVDGRTIDPETLVGLRLPGVLPEASSR